MSGDSGAASAARIDALLPALTILFHSAPRRIGERVLLHELAQGREVTLSRSAPLFAHPDQTGSEQPLADPRLSRQLLRIQPGADGGLRILVENRQAQVRYRGMMVPSYRDISVTELREGGVLELQGAVALVLHLGSKVDTRGGASGEPLGLLGHSHRMQAVRADLRRFAALDTPVLIRGESGTGKELAAQALHALSDRGGRPFLAINLGALPPSLAAAELFGAERGAFTGASARQSGYFQQARNGTLFLDELGAAPLEVQALLLRVIETGELRALGAGVAEKLQARLLAATDADLEAMIRDKMFRLPLLHRLSTCEVRLPALRERREDIGPLFLHFLRSECAAQRRPFLLDAKDAETAPWLPLRILVQLASHDWPGNVRELRNVARQMIALDEGRLSLVLPPNFSAMDTPREPASPEPVASAASPQKEKLRRRRPAEIPEAELLATLEKHRWDLKATAAALDIARPSLYMLLDRMPELRSARHLTAEELAASHKECGGDLDAMAERLHLSRSALRRRLRELQLL